MEQSAIDRMCSGCVQMWVVKDPMSSEPGLTKDRIPACQYMHFLSPEGDAEREYVERFVETEEKFTGVQIREMKRGAIPCRSLSECPNPSQVAKFTRTNMFKSQAVRGV